MMNILIMNIYYLYVTLLLVILNKKESKHGQKLKRELNSKVLFFSCPKMLMLKLYPSCINHLYQPHVYHFQINCGCTTNAL